MGRSFQRCENKYLLSEATFKILQERLFQVMQPDKYCRNGQCYTIFNIYYDTDNNDIIRHSISKPYYKEKLRLRSYTIPDCPDKIVFLELKKKIGGVVSKRRATMKLSEAYDFVEKGKRPLCKDFLNDQVIEEITCFLNRYKVEPKVLISYERMAFFSKENESLRITFDKNIQTSRDRSFSEIDAPNKKLLADDQYLMEIKIPEAIPLWLLLPWGCLSASFISGINGKKDTQAVLPLH